MLLRTFGGLTLEAVAGDGPIPSIGPRRLALLAVVAAAGSRGISRDRILGILWPEAGEEQARHTLSQTLYLLRRETGRDWITGASQLRLDAAVRSDVGEFLDAVSANDAERAAACYGGPFLDGFYLAGVPEFEKWVEETRARLQFAALKVLETLAARDTDAAPAAALNWWRRLGEIDPYSATYAAGQIRALAATGDQPGALRFAREYEAHLQRELEASPDSKVAELVASLRSAEHARVPARAQRTVPDVGSRVEAPRVDVVQRDVWRKWLLRAAVLAVVLIPGMLWTIYAKRTSASSSPPFLAIGLIQSRDTIAAGRVLRDMLSTNLARIPGIQVVSNSRLLELSPRGLNTPEGAVDAARRAGATELIEGEVGVSNKSLVLTLRRVALETGVVRQGYSVFAADAYGLVDSATAAIAHDLGQDPPPNAVATVRTRSNVAYALYEEGLRAIFTGDPATSFRLMQSALERDSTFAMAAYYGWLAARILNRYADADRLQPIAEHLATRAIERERLLIQSSIARERASVTIFLPLAQEFAQRYPTDPDAQLGLGYALGMVGDWAAAADAFNRAIAIDSTAGALHGTICRLCSAFMGLTSSYLWWDSIGAAERAGRRMIKLLPEQAVSWGTIIEPLLRQGRRAEAEAAISKGTALSLSTTSGNFGPTLDRDLIRSGRLDELETRYLSALRSAQPAERGEIPWLLTIGLRNQGRLREAESIARDRVIPQLGLKLDRSVDDAARAIIALEGNRPREGAALWLRMAANDRKSKGPLGFRSRLITWHLTLAGTALAAAGDTAAVRMLADSVERIGQHSSYGRDFTLHYFLRGLILQRQNRHAEAVESFRRSLFSVTEGYTRTNLEMARSLISLGRYQEAVAILQPALRGGVDGSNTYVTHTDLHYMLAHAFEGAGQRDSARVHYAAVERAWRRADPEFAARYREAKAKSINR